MKKKLFFSLFIAILLFLLGLFSFQEKIIFKPTKFNSNYKFKFNREFSEVNIPVDKNIFLSGLLFKSTAAKGVILYLHGNKGNLQEIAKESNLYVNNGFDVLYINYRGFGKSFGSILNEKQLFLDAQKTYDFLKTKYKESQIVLYGISIGSGIATHLAANNKPNSLFLTAPYFSFKKLLNEKLPFIPNFIWEYELNSNEFLSKVTCPVTIFHGEKDKKIPFSHSILLKKNHKNIHLIPFQNYGHTDFLKTQEYKDKVLSEINNHIK